MTGGDETALERAITAALESREAIAFVHVGSDREPAIRYCRPASERRSSTATSTAAIAFDSTDWITVSSAETAGHPAEKLATQLADRIDTGTVLTPARLPHDGALYLEQAGFSLSSTDVVERTRASKTDTEREHIATAQAAASAGLRRGAALLADATIEDGRLVTDGDAVRPDRLRRTIDEGIVSNGGFPVGNTTISSPPSNDSGALQPGEPIVVATAPRDSTGYYGGLVRTLVVDSEGGAERRAHVGVTQAFRSVQAMLTAGTESVTAVEADLEAEIRGFGFGERPIETRVAGVGLEPAERPCDGGEQVEPGSVVRVVAAVEFAPDRWIRIADVLAKHSDRVEWLTAPSRSIEPTALIDH